MKDYVKDAVIYQINLRVFTKEGTIAAAEKFLPDVAATGANIVYLCPFVESDDDPNPEYWSRRQKFSNCQNPRNPYRLMDFYKIDKEYGTAEDFKSFVAAAHKLNLKVMPDLVYMHAGPTFGKRYPDFVKKDGNGNVKLNSYFFCEIDFNSAELREYLWQNMEYFVREFDVDGFRCDVGGAIPLDFWVEGRRRIEKIKSPIIMLDENEIDFRPAEQDEAFDINYCQGWTQAVFPFIFNCGQPVTALKQMWDCVNNARPGGVVIRAIEHHDTANDWYYSRPEKVSSAKCEAAYVLCYTIDGVPFLYNGCEYKDVSRHSIFGNKGQFTIDRSKDPAERFAFLRKLAEFHRTEPAFRDGFMEWLENSQSDTVCTYLRTAPNGEKILCAINLGNETVTVKCSGIESFANGNTLLERDAEFCPDGLKIAADGFAVIKV
ncbi:MAG: hypothetical protein IKB25_11760 [Lentisphaeria bacterium]|nr:hypothetical protein [Lentisphaeria bacterium]